LTIKTNAPVAICVGVEADVVLSTQLSNGDGLGHDGTAAEQQGDLVIKRLEEETGRGKNTRRGYRGRVPKFSITA